MFRTWRYRRRWKKVAKMLNADTEIARKFRRWMIDYIPVRIHGDKF